MAANYVVTASRAGIGSAVVTETDTKTYNVADAGVVIESGTSAGTQTVRVMVLA